jgi:thioredoxin-like negative regulator of GroEL
MRPDERTLILLLAGVHLQQGAAPKAETLYAALAALDPDDSEAAKGLARARLEAGKPQSALAVLDAITGPGEPGAVVQLLRARALVSLERLDDAGVAMRAFGALRAKPPVAKPPVADAARAPRPVRGSPAGSASAGSLASAAVRS